MEGVILIVRSITCIVFKTKMLLILYYDTALTAKGGICDLLNYLLYLYITYIEMPTAYVLINCDLGSEEEIIREIRKLPEAVEVSGVYGVYDIIARISSDSMDKLRETITWHVRRIDKVRSTLTMMVIEGQGEQAKTNQE